MPITLNGTTGITTPAIDAAAGNSALTTLSVAGNNISAVNSMGFRNRIINGDMRIDQRNAGASVTPADGAYTLDRWSVYQFVASKFSVQQNAGAVTPPTGFSNYLGVTSLSAYTVLSGGANTVQQAIEGFNTADLAWGTANAQAVTLSFWVRSSLTGTFGGAVQNSAANRSYPFSFTISAASTWEYKTITISGDTTGTWVGATNGVGLRVFFGLGVGSTYSGTAGAWAGAQYFSATGATSVVGTNGATFYITGVQLEAGSVATPFERRDYGRELYMCQRYCFVETNENSAYRWFAQGYNTSTSGGSFGRPLPQQMRATPSISWTDATKFIIDSAPGASSLTSLSASFLSATYARFFAVTSGGVVSGQSAALASNGDALLRAITYSAEL